MLQREVSLPDDEFVILRPSAAKFAGMALLVLAMIGAEIWDIEQFGGSVMFWGGVFFFGLCLVICLLQLIPGSSSLRLTPEGFEVRSLFRSWRLHRWSGVSGFTVKRVGLLKMVMFSCAHDDHSEMARDNATRYGASGALPDTYGRSAEDLAALMNTWRDRVLHTPEG